MSLCCVPAELDFFPWTFLMLFHFDGMNPHHQLRDMRARDPTD
jgi:hypothetical protein